jgi:hypothetical protein
MLDWNDRVTIKEFIKENDIKDIIQLNNVIKKMTGAMIEEMLEVERDDYLGYPKHERKKETENLRNGYTPKTVRSSRWQRHTWSLDSGYRKCQVLVISIDRHQESWC